MVTSLEQLREAKSKVLILYFRVELVKHQVFTKWLVIRFKWNQFLQLQ